MSTLTVEVVEHCLVALEVHLGVVTREFQEYRAAHGPETTAGLRSEIQAMRLRLDERSFRPPGSGFRLVDPKTMVPDVFDDGGSWQVWSHKAKAYIGMMEASLPLQLTAVEALDDPVSEERLRTAAIDADHEAQLSRFLLLRTSGVPHQIVKGAQADKVSSLETWRRLAARYDPRGLGSDLIELQELTAPERLRAKTIEGISTAIQSWESLERRHSERQGLILPEKVRIAVLLKLVPLDLIRELCRQTTKWSSYGQLKDHLHNIQFCRSTGVAPMVMGNLEPRDLPEEILAEHGEIMRLESRDGKRATFPQLPAANWCPPSPSRQKRLPN